jgi:hypothetical protein
MNPNASTYQSSSYDITNPHSPFFLDYINNRDFAAETGDLGSEGFVVHCGTRQAQRQAPRRHTSFNATARAMACALFDAPSFVVTLLK